MKLRQDAWSDEDDLLLAETVLRHVREGSTQLNAFEEVGDKLNRTSAACGFRWNAVVRHNYEKALQLAKKQRKQRMRALGNGQPVKKQLLYAPDSPMHMMSDEEEELAMMKALENYKPEEYKDEEVEVSSNTTGHSAPVNAPMFTQTPIQQERPSMQPRLSMDQVISFLHSYKTNNEHSTILMSENSRLKRENQELHAMNAELQKKVSRLEHDTVTVQEDYETLMKIMNRARKLVLFDEEERPATSFKMDRNGNLEKLAE